MLQQQKHSVSYVALLSLVLHDDKHASNNALVTRPTCVVGVVTEDLDIP